jgi:hypothetical protein
MSEEPEDPGGSQLCPAGSTRTLSSVRGARLAANPEVLVRVRKDKILGLLDREKDSGGSSALCDHGGRATLDSLDHRRGGRLEFLDPDLCHAIPVSDYLSGHFRRFRHCWQGRKCSTRVGLYAATQLLSVDDTRYAVGLAAGGSAGWRDEIVIVVSTPLAPTRLT